MDRFGADFGAYDDAHDDGHSHALHPFDEDHGRIAEPPLSPVGQDERRMQVRAYNHWAALLNGASFPAIDDLQPEALDDFGPHGVLLDFRGDNAIEDPAIRFLGARLAAECGADGRYQRLSDVPGRSLLSRITDHYLQILANKAPIGFEAEFLNRHGVAVLYRGILLPWSSDGATIDFIFGVINGKEVADAATTGALHGALHGAMEAAREASAPLSPVERSEGAHLAPMLDLADLYPDGEARVPDHAPLELPKPAFGAVLAGEPRPASIEGRALARRIGQPADDDSAGKDTGWPGFTGLGDEEADYRVDYGAQGLEDGEGAEDVDDVVDPLGDPLPLLSEGSLAGLTTLVSRGGRTKQAVVLPGMALPPAADPAAPPPAPPVVPPVLPQVAEEAPTIAQPSLPLAPSPLSSVARTPEPPANAADVGPGNQADTATPPRPTPVEPEGAGAPDAEAEGLYDCLAAARELAQTARSSEDRGRRALYQAVSRAYDFSLEAGEAPEDFAELLAENGLTRQDRAPMTPIVKLVFGADYDKTRLTEYATVLSHAHRVGVARGTLDDVLARAEGGLKGVVQAERRARREASGQAPADALALRPALAKRLRGMQPLGLGDLAPDGGEFALVMIRRMPAGEPVVLGEIPHDRGLLEKAARRLPG